MVDRHDLRCCQWNIAPCRNQLQPVVLGQNLGGITTVVFKIASADVELEATLYRTRTRHTLLQDFDADSQVGNRVEGRELAAEIFLLFAMDFCHDLHQPLCPHGALCKRVKA